MSRTARWRASHGWESGNDHQRNVDRRGRGRQHASEFHVGPRSSGACGQRALDTRTRSTRVPKNRHARLLATKHLDRSAAERSYELVGEQQVLFLGEPLPCARERNVVGPARAAEIAIASQSDAVGLGIRVIQVIVESAVLTDPRRESAVTIAFLRALEHAARARPAANVG